MSRKVYLDGKLVPQNEAKISVFDHGLLYGDGVFEGIRSYSGNIFRLDDHIDRLFDSARAIVLSIPMSRKKLADAIRETLAANKLTDAYIRVVVTRGPGTLGLNPFLCKKPSVIIITDKIQLYSEEDYEKGLAIVTVPTIRNHPGALDPRIKSLNYLNNILAKLEGLNAGVTEALMLNSSGLVAECTGDNIFIVTDGELLTPPISAGILKGITRDVVMEIARDSSIRVREPNLSRYDLLTADECFLCGTAAEIIAVVKIDERTIGDGKPGKITQSLLKKFRELTS